MGAAGGSLLLSLGNFSSGMNVSVSKRKVSSVRDKDENGERPRSIHNEHQRRMDNVVPGDGWQILHSFPGDNCDGSLSSSSSCGRLPSSNCLMEGHQGSRGGIWGDEAAGWLVMTVKGVEAGYVALNLEFGSRTDRSLKKNEDSIPRFLRELPDAFILEYAIDGNIVTLEKPKFLQELKQPVSGMGLLTVLNDEMSVTVRDLTVAVRVRGCIEVECQIGVTHVYWS